MPVTIRDHIYSDIESQFPSVYKENSEFFISFVEAYYQYLDQKNDRDIPKLRDIDSTLPTFFVYYKKKYLADLPIDSTVDVPFIIKHIDDLYTRKGTKESLELLFKMFFNEDITVFYPGSNILKPSHNLWGGESFLEMKTVFVVDGYPILRGNTIKGDLSGAEAFVDDIVFVNFSGALTPILYMSNLKGTFVADDSLEVISATNDGVETIVNVGKLIAGSISDVEISKAVRLPNQREGDTIDIVSKKSGTGAKGIITSSSEAQVGSIDYEIIDGGYGYIKPNTIPFNENTQIEISNQVIILKGDTPYQLEKGQTIVFPGSTIDYTGRDAPLAPQYSVNGSAVITDYRHPLLFIQTKTDKDQLFEAFTETHQVITDGQVEYRNLLFDSFLNAFYFKNNSFDQIRPLPASLDKYYKFLNQPTEPSEKYGGSIYASYLGDENSVNDMLKEGSFSIAETQFFISYQFAMNNGLNDVEIYDTPTDFDSWLNLGNFGQVDPVALESEVVDRIPTISPLTPPQTATIGIDRGGVKDLNNGQVYTLEYKGSNMTDDDFSKIGCNSAIIGTDFVFTDANLANLSLGGFAHDLEKYDAVFTASKQVLAKFNKFLQLVGVFPNITIGSNFTPPPNFPDTVTAFYPANDANGDALAIGDPHPKAGQPDYAFYSNYLVPAVNLVAGREYYIQDFGTTSFADWNLLGANLDTRTIPTGYTNRGLSTSIFRGKEYLIQDVGSTPKATWESIGWVANQNGAGTTPVAGDRFNAPSNYTYNTYPINITQAGSTFYTVNTSTSSDSGGVVGGDTPSLTMDVGDTMVIDNTATTDADLKIRTKPRRTASEEIMSSTVNTGNDRLEFTVDHELESGDLVTAYLEKRFVTTSLPDGDNGTPTITNIHRNNASQSTITGTNLDNVAGNDYFRYVDTSTNTIIGTFKIVNGTVQVDGTGFNVFANTLAVGVDITDFTDRAFHYVRPLATVGSGSAEGNIINGSLADTAPNLNDGTIETFSDLTHGAKYYVARFGDDALQLYTEESRDISSLVNLTPEAVSEAGPVGNSDTYDNYGLEVRLVRDQVDLTGTEIVYSGTNSAIATFAPTVAGTYYYQRTNQTTNDPLGQTNLSLGYEDVGSTITVSDKPTQITVASGGTGKVINISEAVGDSLAALSSTTGIRFTASALADGVTISGTGFCLDYSNIITPTGESNSAFYTASGMFNDPLKDSSGATLTSVPDELSGTSFLGFVDGDYFNTIECQSIGQYNASSSFDVSEVTDTEVIRLTTDIIGDHFNEIIEPRKVFDGTDVSAGLFTITKHGFVDGEQYIFQQGDAQLGGISSQDLENGQKYYAKSISENTFELYDDYVTGTFSNKKIPANQNGSGHSLKRWLGVGVPPEYYASIYETSGELGVENIDTTYRDAFKEQSFTIGSISNILEDSPGTNYQNDVGVRVLNNIIAQYDLRDLIMTFDIPPFTLQKNDIIRQQIRSPYEGPVTDTEAVYVKGEFIDPDATVSSLFTRSVTVNGLKIVASGAIGGAPEVSDEFALKVARVVELLMDRDAPEIDETAQRKMISTLSGDVGTTHEGVPTAQRVAYGSGSAYTPNFLTDSGQQQYTGYTTFLNSYETNDMIWYKPTGGPNPGVGDRDIEEVLEHLLHTIHLYGVPGSVEGSATQLNWIATGDATWQSTELYLALKEAIDGNMFDPSAYAPLWRTDQSDAELAYKEYLYFLNWGMWSMSEFWDGGSKSPEWSDSMRTPIEILSNNPLGYALFNKYIAPVLSKPDPAILRTIFQNNDAGVSGYVNTPITSYLSAKEIANMPLQSTLKSIGAYRLTQGDVSTPGPYSQSVTTFELQEEKYDVKLKFLKREGTEFYFRPVSFFGVDKSKSITIRSKESQILTMKKDPNSLPMGANAQILGAAEYSTGQLDSIKVLHTGYKYEDDEEVDIINTTPSSPTYNQKVATGVLNTAGQGNTEGRWKDNSSFLNESSARIHDNNYYQEYSYDVSTMTDPKIYTPLVKDVVGVAGTKLFNTPLINSVNSFESTVDVSIITYDVVVDNFAVEGIGHLGDVNQSIDGDVLTADGTGHVGNANESIDGDILVSVTQEEADRIVGD